MTTDTFSFFREGIHTSEKEITVQNVRIIYFCENCKTRKTKKKNNSTIKLHKTIRT